VYFAGEHRFQLPQLEVMVELGLVSGMVVLLLPGVAEE
jgi:hypothetical protein